MMETVPTNMTSGERSDQPQRGWECRQVPGLSPIPYDIYEAVRVRVTDATRAIAAIKNLPARVVLSVSTDATVELLHFDGLCEQLLVEDRTAIEQMEYFIDNQLDGLAIREAIFATVRAESWPDHEIDWTTLTLWADEAFIRLRDRVAAGTFYRWGDIEGGVQLFADIGMPYSKLRLFDPANC